MHRKDKKWTKKEKKILDETKPKAHILQIANA